LFDRTGWYAALKVRTNVPYPEGLRRALIAACFPILREIIPSYRYNVEKSLARRDLVFINNEVTWLLANYFEVIFAFNRVAHPGSKRLPAQAARLCQAIPVEMDRLVNDVLRLAGTGDPGVLGAIDRLVDGLEEMLGEEKPA
jgi:hypothetical protein